MRVNNKHRVLIAWMLLFMLVPMYVAKTMHTHRPEHIVHSVPDGINPQLQSVSSCYICQFLVSPCLSVQFYSQQQLPLVLTAFYVQPDQRFSSASVLFYNLRAPPVAWFLLVTYSPFRHFTPCFQVEVGVVERWEWCLFHLSAGHLLFARRVSMFS